MADASSCVEVWTHGDLIDLGSLVVSFALGLLGAWFIYTQNKILHRQNELMDKQNDIMIGQNSIMDKQNKHNDILLSMQNKKDLEALVLSDSKVQFLRTIGQAGVIQGEAQRLREMYPSELKTIVRAYAEIASIDQRFPKTEKFLNFMRGYKNEDWPDYP